MYTHGRSHQDASSIVDSRSSKDAIFSSSSHSCGCSMQLQMSLRGACVGFDAQAHVHACDVMVDS